MIPVKVIILALFFLTLKVNGHKKTDKILRGSFAMVINKLYFFSKYFLTWFERIHKISNGIDDLNHLKREWKSTAMFLSIYTFVL